MRKLIAIYKQFSSQLHLRWISHYSRVTGEPVASGFSFALYDSISKLPVSDWDNANTSGDIFLTSEYLLALEQAPPENMSFRYVVINNGNEIVGIAYFQIIALNYRLHQSPLQSIHPVKTHPFLQKVHNKLIDTAGTTLLVCGNAMISGEHGFCISKIPEDRALHVIAEIAHTIRKSGNPHIMAILIKDFCKKKTMPSDVLSQFGYHLVNAGPNMIIPIRKNWSTFDAYLSEMKPKYRKRAASAIKKGLIIRRQSFTLEDIMQFRDEIYKLYCHVVNNAKVKFFFLSPDYFISLKRHLKDNFECVGYFLEKEMVGFTTRITNGVILEGYSHGLRYDCNKEFELYQNFLLDDVMAAISAKSSYVNTGRTSVAMKSSVGAIPMEMVCYIRFSGGHSNHLFKPLFSFIKPSNEYCRNPFE